MPSMSYCVVENVSGDLGTMYDVLNRLINDGEPINKYEQRNLKGCIEQMQDIIALYESGVEDGVIDEDGKLLDSDSDSDDSDDDDSDY